MALISAPAGDRNESRRLQRLAAAGRLRRLYSGLYTDDLVTPLEALVRQELLGVLASVAPNAVISHRSAIEMQPTLAGDLFLTGNSRRTVDLPGLRLRIEPGPGPLADDIRVPTRHGPVWRSSEARAYLENLQQSRGKTEERRTLGPAVVEGRLEGLLTRSGDAALNGLRDHARTIAEPLGLTPEFSRFERVVGALLGTRRSRLKNPAALARYRGMPVDPHRVELFAALARALETTPPMIPAARAGADTTLAAFCESYFSNYIEGTEFEIEEAREIVLEGRDVLYREDDSHDIRGTFRAVLRSQGDWQWPQTFDAFCAQLRDWNREVIYSRSAKQPGEWKTLANRAGSSHFVAPDLVLGTLEKGYELLAATQTNTARAALAMFVVTEVHPFQDGNGRTARLAMNAVLSAAGLTRIIVPTVFRDDYWSALKALTGSLPNEQPFPVADPFVRMLDRAASFSAWLDFSSWDRVNAQLERSNAMSRPGEAKLTFTVSA